MSTNSSEVAGEICPGSVIYMLSTGKQMKYRESGFHLAFNTIPDRQLFLVLAACDGMWLVMDQNDISWITFEGSTNVELVNPNECKRT